MVTKILVVNAAVWLGFLVFAKFSVLQPAVWLFAHLRLDVGWASGTSLFGGEIWQLFSYMWLHDLDGPLHLLFNSVVLWMVGPMFERRWGAKAFLSFYLKCGVGAGVVSALFALISQANFGYPIVGASGAILGLVAAFGLLYSEQTLYLWFVVPVKAKWIIPLIVVLDLLMFFGGNSDFALAAHLGGLLTGYLLVTGLWRTPRLKARWELWKRKMRRRRSKIRLVRNSPDERGPWIH